MNSAPDVERLEKVARAALVGSPQGWTAHPADGDYDYFVDAGGAYLGACPDCGVRSSFDKEDATHIATFDPPTALALVAEVRELRAKVERVRGIIGPRDLLDPHQGGCEGLADETLLSILDALGEEA